MTCGGPLDDAIEAEQVRKTVTIVFSDLVNSTALGEHLDPEAVAELLTTYFGAMRVIIERHGGTVEQVPSAMP